MALLSYSRSALNEQRKHAGQQLLSERTFYAKTTITVFGRHPSTFTWVMVNNQSELEILSYSTKEINSFGYLWHS